MFRKISSYIYQFRKANGLEVFIQKDDSVVCRIVCISIRNKKVVIEHQQEWILSKSSPKVNISMREPVNVIFNGKGILQKKIYNNESDKNVIATTFPQINPDDFYSETVTFKDSRVAFICRKELVDSKLSFLTDLGFKIINIHLGFSVASNIIPFLTPEDNQLKTESSFILKIENGELSDYSTSSFESSTNQKEYLISNQYVKAANIMALGAAFELITENIEIVSPVSPTDVILAKKEHKDYLLFKFILLSLGSTMLLVLLINYFVFAHFFAKNQEFEAAKFVNKESLINQKKIEGVVVSKQKLLDISGWENNYKTSFYADRIASLVPSEIKLSLLSFNPAEKQRKGSRQSASYRNKIIEIQGECENPLYVNLFANNLKNLPGVKGVFVVNYHQGRSKGSGFFTIEINIV